ncbi:CRISPR system precrRNA processing endoribonuclease RAMP protein Cas6 [candidate division KSB1 bacterium]|nr:CRISPR system precrRNA processing endoribonuclease RAMP protein Cas6 [candidate division KSB1 bacterium]
MNFSFARLGFSIKAIDTLHLYQFAGSTLRGAFGNILKNIICIHSNKKLRVCNNCILKSACIYSYIFETPVTDTSTSNRMYTNYAPHPFIIEPPLINQEQEYKKGESVNFHFVLIGNSLKLLPYFIYTFEKMGESGLGKYRSKFELQKVWVDSNNEKINIYSKNKRTLSLEYPVQKYSYFDDMTTSSDKLKIQFITPVRMKHNGKLVRTIEFPIVVTNLLRRITSLTQVKDKDGVKIKEMINKSKEVKKIYDRTEWVDYERYSFRQKSRMKLGGLIGEVHFQGSFNLFYPYLKVGEYIHLGKNTSFGLGKYLLIE